MKKPPCLNGGLFLFTRSCFLNSFTTDQSSGSRERLRSFSRNVFTFAAVISSVAPSFFSSSPAAICASVAPSFMRFQRWTPILFRVTAAFDSGLNNRSRPVELFLHHGRWIQFRRLSSMTVFKSPSSTVSSARGANRFVMSSASAWMRSVRMRCFSSGSSFA